MPECVPVYERTGGHVYKSVYPGPIGAILTPQLKGLEDDGVASLPYASSLCCACYEVCPVKIDIPKVLVHQRGKIVDEKKRRGNLKARLDPEHVGMKWMARVFRDPKKYERAQKIAQTGRKYSSGTEPYPNCRDNFPDGQLCAILNPGWFLKTKKLDGKRIYENAVILKQINETLENRKNEMHVKNINRITKLLKKRDGEFA